MQAFTPSDKKCCKLLIINMVPAFQRRRILSRRNQQMLLIFSKFKSIEWVNVGLPIQCFMGFSDYIFPSLFTTNDISFEGDYIWMVCGWGLVGGFKLDFLFFSF